MSGGSGEWDFPDGFISPPVRNDRTFGCDTRDARPGDLCVVVQTSNGMHDHLCIFLGHNVHGWPQFWSAKYDRHYTPGHGFHVSRIVSRFSEAEQ